MQVYVLNHKGRPLMPCSPRKARLLLREERVKVIKRVPFTIQWIVPTRSFIQPVTLGVDSGYTYIGLSAVTEKQELYEVDVKLRTNIVKLISERRMYRKNRRSRNTWYRKPRFLNRGIPRGWLAPSIQHKLDSHIRIIYQIKSILPVSQINIEVAAFDIQKIKNSEIEGAGYQDGEQKGFWNTREYVLYRDGHTCQHCKGKSKDKILEVHHIVSRQTGGDRPGNLITLCSACHDKVSQGKVVLNIKPSNGFKAEAFMSMVRWKLVNQLRELGNICNYTYGYITKSKRIALGLPKSHMNDAFVIAGGKEQNRVKGFTVNQCRRNNRCLQLNRKGFRPSIRRQRYNYHPGDLVKLNKDVYKVRGVHSYGKQIRLVNKNNSLLDVSILKVSLLKYQRGFASEYQINETL